MFRKVFAFLVLPALVGWGLVFSAGMPANAGSSGSGLFQRIAASGNDRMLSSVRGAHLDTVCLAAVAATVSGDRPELVSLKGVSQGVAAIEATGALTGRTYLVLCRRPLPRIVTLSFDGGTTWRDGWNDEIVHVGGNAMRGIEVTRIDARGVMRNSVFAVDDLLPPPPPPTAKPAYRSAP